MNLPRNLTLANMLEQTQGGLILGADCYRWQLHTLGFAYVCRGWQAQDKDARCRKEAKQIAKAVNQRIELPGGAMTDTELREVVRLTHIRMVAIMDSNKP